MYVRSATHNWFTAVSSIRLARFRKTSKWCRESVVELNRTFRNTFAIVDGVIGMEGNGPIQGTPKHSGVLVMGSDLVAVDATCCRIMGIDPEKVDYLRMAANLGHVHPGRIEQRGETVASVQSNFALIEEFQHLRLA